MTTDHRTITATVAPPDLPSADADQARAAAREKALNTNTDRTLLLTATAQGVEAFIGRAIWRGKATGGHRRSVSVVAVRDQSRPVSLCPLLPDVSGVSVSGVEVKRWNDAAGAFEAASYTLRPGARVLATEPGEFEVACDLLPAEDRPAAVVEALARTWAYRETVRPGDVTDFGAERSLAGAIHRSGAAELLQAVRTFIPM